MNISLRLIVAAGALGFALQAHAESFASSASSAGSASSGSVSDSLSGSSNSSHGDRKVADGEYRIIQIAATPDRAGRTRVTMQADDPQQRIVLDLPQATFDQQGLAAGDVMYAHNRVYGVEFGRGDTRQPFYLVLADEWYGELASRPVGI
jgi:type IV secretory pathway TrbL component